MFVAERQKWEKVGVVCGSKRKTEKDKKGNKWIRAKRFLQQWGQLLRDCGW